MRITKIAMLGLCCALLPGCVTMVEHLVPQATIMDKQYDFVADIELHYAGNTIRTRRHFQYYLFRNFDKSGRETGREFTVAGDGYVKLSDTDGAIVLIGRPSPPPFQGSIPWRIDVGQIYRMQPNAQSEMRCVLVGEGAALASAKAVLTRLPARSSGYPSEGERFHFAYPPVHDTKACQAFLDAGSVDETITRD